MNCTNCGAASQTEYCATCEPLRERLESLRAAQKQFWRDVRSGKRELVHPPKRSNAGAHFVMQSRKYAAQRVAERLAQQQTPLPARGQDAALPPGDRE
jgi:hypothetical protein